MPELPEVENVVRGLRVALHEEIRRSSSISQVKSSGKKLRRPWQIDWEEGLVGNCIQGVSRRAKYVVIHLRQGDLISHLGMSGSWRLAKDSEVKVHDHIRLHVGEQTLIYNDPRRFGFLVYLPEGAQGFQPFRELGPEPLAKEFTPSYLWRCIRESEKSIKSLIMEQKIVVGVGNIYACESLFAAGVQPQRKGRGLAMADCQRLVSSIQKILIKAIEAGGSSISDHRLVNGQSGKFQNEFQVYGRKGQLCVKCGHKIKAMMITGRNSFYCGRCQK